MTKAPANLAASVRARLLNISRQTGEDFTLTLTRYTTERFLYRLSVSKHADKFLLKGAALFAVWTKQPYRPTRDIDLLGWSENSATALHGIFAEAAAEQYSHLRTDEPGKLSSWRRGMQIERRLMRIAAPMAAVLLGSLIAAQRQTKAAAKPFVYGSHDLFYVVEIPAGWEYSGNEESNEIVITKGDASVSVAVLNNDEGITVERFLEYRKSILRQQCPAAEFRDQGKGTVAGGSLLRRILSVSSTPGIGGASSSRAKPRPRPSRRSV